MSNSEIFMEERDINWAEPNPFNYADYDQWRESEEKAQSALDIFEKGLSKSNIRAMADATIENVLKTGNVLQVAEALSAMECFIKEIKSRKEFTDYVREEAGKTPKGYVSNSGAKIELTETGSAYDFSKCNDPLLNLFELECENAKSKLDARKEFLKKVDSKGLEILTSDGEVITIYPPAKSSNSSYKVTLSK